MAKAASQFKAPFCLHEIETDIGDGQWPFQFLLTEALRVQCFGISSYLKWFIFKIIHNTE